jgi:Tol biopolymer transport system component
MVVYASDRAGGQLDLWLQRTAGGQPLRLTSDPADDRQPAFSPDGSLIAFRSNRAGGGVYVMPALGGDSRLIAEAGRRPRFSPDGRSIAYWTGPWLSGAGPRGPGSSVFIVPATGGKPARVAEGFSSARDPVWSSDGKSVLFFGRKSSDTSPAGVFDWWWAPLDGRDPVPTGAAAVLKTSGLYSQEDMDNLSQLMGVPADWTSSGLLFSARLGESVNIWRLAVSEQTGRAIEKSLERLTNGTGSDLLASADQVGRVVFQQTTEGYASLVLPLDANGGRASGSIARHSFVAGAMGGRNSLDQTGRWLAYTKTHANETEIWVKDLTRDDERHLVTTARAGLNPVIAPDGAKVAYSLVVGNRSSGHIVSASGGTAKQICAPCALFSWFADSRRIVAASREGMVSAIDVVDGKSWDLLMVSGGGVGRPGISPDGRWLSFEARGKVWLAPVRLGNPPPDSEWVPVHDIGDNTAERACGWSPDSRLLYLLLERDGFRDLYAQRVDATRGTPQGDPFVVQHLHDPRRQWGSTPIGTAIVPNAFVFSQTEMTGSIWLLDSTAEVSR